MAREPRRVCAWTPVQEALRHFATYEGPTQSAQHIKPLHWYVACRLVLEGGFRPEDVTPRPPFRSEMLSKQAAVLHFDPEVATGSERTVLGGLKTKNVDVVVALDGLGPVVGISCKGMTGALRNLTNRMEELIGECTNLHITYPALVFGFLFLLRANRHVEEDAAEVTVGRRELQANDIAFGSDGPVATVVRFHNALQQITGRRGIRNDVSRYEAVSLLAVEATGPRVGESLNDFPTPDGQLRFERFFETLYRRYDERFVLGAPDLTGTTFRRMWSPESPAFQPPSLPTSRSLDGMDFEPRIGTGT